jgi:deoxyribodipyrimidine photo-lyase
MKFKRVVVWFRNDLRVHDHAPLFYASQNAHEIIPVYCIDPRSYVKMDLGLEKTGNLRAKFLGESVYSLRINLQQLGGELVILRGKPEQIIPAFSETYQAEAIFFSEEVADEEKRVEVRLEKTSWEKGINTKSFWQSTLFHIQDLPFPVEQTPEVFTQFRKECEKFSKIRKTLPVPKQINFPLMELDLEDFPNLSTFGLNGNTTTLKSFLAFKGGEDEGIRRIQTYFWELDQLKVYKETRNGLLGADYSSKFSPWLAMGCTSPRFIYEEIKRYERERVENQSTYWLIFELIWRDYFRFMCKKHGNKFFQLKGLKNNVDNWKREEGVFWKWAKGETGIPFVDANMRELNETGFMSNRGRQNVASFLVNDLRIDWRWGASYFESRLLDYDVYSNWGNWMYIAGVGNDPRENRYFNIIRQAQNYDPKGDYVRYWIPELADIPGFEIHQPFEMSTSRLKEYGISLGITYPHPLVRNKAWR